MRKNLKYRVIERFRDKHSVADMCEVFEVFRSGCCAWRKREAREGKDAQLVERIRLCQKRCGQTYGCRRVRMWPEKNYGDMRAVMDLCGKMVLACRIGSDMASSLVTDTVRDAINKNMVADGPAIHSGQGGQYTSRAYYDLSQKYHISLSMSSPGCPYDNAAMENFYGTFKCKCLNRVTIPDRTALSKRQIQRRIAYGAGAVGSGVHTFLQLRAHQHKKRPHPF